MSPNNVLWLWSLSVKVSGTQNFHLNFVNYMVNTPYDILHCVIDVSPNNVLRLQRIGIFLVLTSFTLVITLHSSKLK